MEGALLEKGGLLQVLKEFMQVLSRSFLSLFQTLMDKRVRVLLQ
jgi:hypothetical protein